MLLLFKIVLKRNLVEDIVRISGSAYTWFGELQNHISIACNSLFFLWMWLSSNIDAEDSVSSGNVRHRSLTRYCSAIQYVDEAVVWNVMHS